MNLPPALMPSAAPRYEYLRIASLCLWLTTIWPSSANLPIGFAAGARRIQPELGSGIGLPAGLFGIYFFNGQKAQAVMINDAFPNQSQILLTKLKITKVFVTM
jgi:hypothetical protein